MFTRQLILTGMLAAGALSHTLAAAETEEAKPSTTQNDRAAGEVGPVWSEPVAGLQARIELSHSSVSHGTPILSTTLHLRNVAGVINALEVPWSRGRMTFRMVDAAGKDQRTGFRGGSEYSGPGQPAQVDLVLPYKGNLSFDISGQGLGIPGDQVASIDLGPSDCWILSREDGACSLHAVLEITDDKKKHPASRPWHGRIELPPVAVPLTVAPLDPATADAVIRRLGLTMVSGAGGGPREAIRALSLIADERVIPWYVKAMDTTSYEHKCSALDRLSRFPGDEALTGLKKGMTTQAADIANCDAQALAAQMAVNVRHFAASALARSPHPDARRLLLTMSDDPASAVRGAVTNALGKMTSDESLALLRRLSEDSDPYVRNQASGFPKSRTEKTPDSSDSSDN